MQIPQKPIFLSLMIKKRLNNKIMRLLSTYEEVTVYSCAL